MVLGLQSIVSREIDALKAAVITVGSIQAGATYNVVPESATIKIGVRALDPKVRTHIEARLRDFVAAQARSFQLEAEVVYERKYPVLVNHERQTERAREAAVRLLGEDKVVARGPVMGSEDFAPTCWSIVPAPISGSATASARTAAAWSTTPVRLQRQGAAGRGGVLGQPGAELPRLSPSDRPHESTRNHKNPQETTSHRQTGDNHDLADTPPPPPVRRPGRRLHAARRPARPGGGTLSSRPLSLVVPYPAGGATDASARIFAESIGKSVKQQVVVENYGGGTGLIGANKVLAAPADGYTFFAGSINEVFLAPLLNPSARYKPQDFLLAAPVSDANIVLLVRSGLAADSLDKFLTLPGRTGASRSPTPPSASTRSTT